MPTLPYISIDQNSNPLWDTPCKLDALAHHGYGGVHAVEDVDVAFTRNGASADDTELLLATERIYRGGVQDWGATLFYTRFLGRNPIDVRELEPYTGTKTSKLAKQLDTDVDSLYATYGDSDNWQLIGSSYWEQDPNCHRVIGDLRTEEIAPALRELLERAQADLENAVPDTRARHRIQTWFEHERHRVDGLLGETAGQRITDLYTAWMQSIVQRPHEISRTSNVLGLDTAMGRNGLELLDLFTRDYQDLADLYNQAVDQTGVGVNRLRVDRGDLPFFAVWQRGERMVRTALRLDGDTVDAGLASWPAATTIHDLRERLAHAGCLAVTGKALLLVLQVRLAPHGAALALPYNGSLYMPAAFAFERALRDQGLIRDEVLPVYRVRLRFVEHWRGLDTTIRLPEYMVPAFAAAELPAGEVAARLPDVLARARHDLELMRSDQGRSRWLAARFPDEHREIEELEEQRRQLARDPETRDRAAVLWDRVKALQTSMRREQVEAAWRNLHLLNLDYWDSRGAIIPWSIALDGPGLYADVLHDAEIHREEVVREG